MKTLSKILLFTLISSFSFSQKYEVKWGEMGKSKGTAYDVLPLGGSDFYTLRVAGSAMFPQYKVTAHKNFEMTSTGRLVLKANGRSAILEGAKMIGGKFIVFLSDKDGDENNFYMQEYNDDLEPKGRAILLAKYNIEKRKPRGSFDIITSRDKGFFAVEWTLPGKREDADRYGYKVYDADLNEISTGEYELPFDGNLTSINMNYLSNTGDYFLAVSEYERSTDRKKLIGTYVDYKAMHLFHITPDGAEQYTLETDGKRVESITMNSDNNGVFSLVGAYGNKGVGGIAGIFNIKLNFFKKTVISQGFEKFTKDFITQDWSDRAKEKADKKAAKGKGEPNLFKYVMRGTEVLKDGRIIGSMEQYYVEVRTYTDSKGNTRTVYYYYYNDIITFLIGKTGEFDWVTKIDKYQVSTNDGGPFSSYARFVDGEKIVFIFNDNANNYDDKGQYFVEKGRVAPANYRKKKNVVAITTVEMKKGEVERETFFDRSELSAIAVPKKFNVDYNNGEVLLYAIMRSKERFGLLRLDNKRK